MKKVFLFAAAIFLTISHSEAQPEQHDAQKGDFSITATPGSLCEPHIASYSYSRNIDRPGKRQTLVLQYFSVLPGAYFLGNYSKAKPVVSATSSFSMKLPAYSVPKVNTANLSLTEVSTGAGLFDCGIDRGNGMSIGLTRNACLNLDFGYDDTDTIPDVTDKFADSDESHDLDISVGLLIGIR